MSSNNQLTETFDRYSQNEFVQALVVVILIIILGAGLAFVFSLLTVNFNAVERMASVASAGGTLILAVITAFYVILTHSLVRETQEAREQDVAPVVTLDIQDHEPVITNVGNGPASHIHLSIQGYPDGPGHEISLPHLRSGESRSFIGDTYEELFNPANNPKEKFDTIQLIGACYDGFGNQRSVDMEFGIPMLQQHLMGDSTVI